MLPPATWWSDTLVAAAAAAFLIRFDMELAGFLFFLPLAVTDGGEAGGRLLLACARLAKVDKIVGGI